VSERDRFGFERAPQTIGDLVGQPLSTSNCPHVKAYPARRVISGGQARPWLLCPDCGHSRALKMAEYPDLGALPEFDDGIRDRVYEKNHILWQEKMQREREERSAQWWDAYHAYLSSPEWRERRRRVLKRANGVCEACLEQEATQVHHETYKHVGNEPLFELRAVCVECHERITELDRKAG
jgi:hypothetical protein